ncbi:glutamate racemase [Levilactobacillus yiduensis]|uniref:glutamate racemase n=1 Tax=Levilactobacillus yiduensis TaxID=2953880 RepID=UPI000EF315AA|nr:glutamate racemase [Levilactobacillus yiduensis]AYM03508.1 glutamate racemase [Levilactobacillus brevis]
MQTDPIGLMDSGVGGLTVLKEVQRVLPAENTVFLGDQARLPYGPRSPEEVTTFTRQIATYLRQQANMKLFIIACNTATAAALSQMQAELPVPVVGVIAPGATMAAQTTKNHQIGVIATEGTVNSGQYQRDILAADAKSQVISVACPQMVTLAEQNDLDSDHARQIVAQNLAPLQGTGIDTLVMGCTHFPLLRDAIQAAVGPDVMLIDPGVAAAQKAAEILKQQHALNVSGEPVTATYFTTGDVKQFNQLASEWLDLAPKAVTHLPESVLDTSVEAD